MYTTSRKPLYKAVVCADGFSMSVQASTSAYSKPRHDDGPYTEVEVGFPSEEESLLLPYAEDSEKLTETVYPYVPVTKVSLVLAKHGGVVEGELPDGVPMLKSEYGQK
jgi:hypothetical protein